MRQQQVTLLVAGLLCCGLWSTSARAVDFELEGGKSLTSSRTTNAVFGEATFHEYRFGNSLFTWTPDVSIGWIGGRNKVDERIDGYTLKRDVYLFSGGARFRVGYTGDWYHNLFLSFQPAATKGRTIALSSAGEFNTSIGWSWNHINVRVRHVSNGGFHAPNRGETMLLVGTDFNL